MGFSLPNFQIPSFSMPDIGMPDIGMPDVQTPDVDNPDFDMPGVDMPGMQSPSVDTPNTEGQKQASFDIKSIFNQSMGDIDTKADNAEMDDNKLQDIFGKQEGDLTSTIEDVKK